MMSIDIPDCTKLPLSEHIEAYIKRNKVIREHVESIQCNQDLVDKVIYNYLIVKRILKNLYWQDLMVCKHVCKTWHAAIKSLALECRGPREFGIIFKPGRSEFIKSGNFNVEPLLVLTFICVKYKEIMIRECKSIVPKTCQSSCGEYHCCKLDIPYYFEAYCNHHIDFTCVLDIVDKFTSAPKDCMITVICQKSEDRFIPLPVEDVPYNCYFVAGLYIPIIPQVRCHRIIIRPEHPFHCLSITSSIDRIAKNEIFKGVIVFASNDMYGNALNSTVWEHLKEVQPNVPFAIGGCVTECTIKHSDVKIKNNTIALNNIMSIIAFTVPKNKENESNFDMFSLILDSKLKTKDNIEQAISQFSYQVPRFEYSAAIKLGSLKRHHKYKIEDDCFRSCFPDTTFTGCCCVSGLGTNHPAEPDEDIPTPKRIKMEPMIYYNNDENVTVFMYIGWGKVTATMGPIAK